MFVTLTPAPARTDPKLSNSGPGDEVTDPTCSHAAGMAEDVALTVTSALLPTHE